MRINLLDRTGGCNMGSAAKRSSYPLTHYVVLREDLPLGLMVAQAVHAAGESSPGNLPTGTYAVVLAVPDEEALLHYAERLRYAGIEHKLIGEPDLKPYRFLEGEQATAIGIPPTTDRPAVRKILGMLPLLKEAVAA